MKRTALMTVLMAAMIAGGTATASGTTDYSLNMNTEGVMKYSKPVNVRYFSRIDIKGSTDVVFRQTNGGKPQVTIVGNKDDVDRVAVSSDGKTLTIAQKSNAGGWHLFGSGDEVKVYISAPDLTAVNIIGSGDFDTKGKIDTDNLSVTVRGSGDVEMGSVICDNASIQVFGSGDVEIKNLVAQRNTDISVKGSGDIEVGFSKSGYVACSVYGSGDVELKGYVKGLKKKIKGSGDIDTSKLKKW